MKQIWITRKGEPSVLEVREKETPAPGFGEVRVKVEAAGVNFADLMARLGNYLDAPPLPAVVGYEAAGKIDAVGPGGDESLVGTDVVAVTQFGGYSTHVVVKEAQAIPRPPAMDARTAAAIPVTGLTAWIMIEEMGRVREGDRVLVHSAGGSVGLMALDLIKRRGGIAVGTASGHKHAFLKERGYDELVDYRTQDFEKALEDGPGFDLILDPLGGDAWAKGFRLLRTTGRLICFGMSASTPSASRSVLSALKTAVSTPWLMFNPVTLLNANKGVMGVNMGRMWNEVDRLAGWLRSLIALWEEGSLRVQLHAAVPFSNAPEAHRILHDRENLGKVVLVPDEFA